MKEKILQALLEYFCFNGKDGTYAYNLTRVKEAFAYGTVTLDDFEEFTEEQMEELADFIVERCEKPKGARNVLVQNIKKMVQHMELRKKRM